MSTTPLLRVSGIRDPLTDALWTEEDEVSAANWSEFDVLLAATEVSAVRRDLSAGFADGELGSRGLARNRSFLTLVDGSRLPRLIHRLGRG